MSTKKDAALDALHNLHFADRAAGNDLLEKLFDALEEVAEERYAAHVAARIEAPQSDDVVTLDEPVVVTEGATPTDPVPPAEATPSQSAEAPKDA